MEQPQKTEAPAGGLFELNAGLGVCVEMKCGNCAHRSGEECETNGGREVYADDDKPDWCDSWSENV